MRRGLLLGALTFAAAMPALAGGDNPASPVDPWMIVPFALLLLAMALGPLLHRTWWERRYPWVAFGLGAVTVAYYVGPLGNPERMLRSGIEYVSFIALIGSLFVVAGGIVIRLRGGSTPLRNAALLAAGAVASNVLGTTGASMVLIRPYLRVNKHRLRAYHVVFFIFVVANIGGALTPIGDPPLFLGFLRGVPFFWVLENVWPAWLLTLAVVLAVFFAIDFLAAAGSERHPGGGTHDEAELSGLHNLFFLVVILAAVFIEHPPFLREGLMAAAAAGSWLTTRREIHERNGFDFAPVKEVAVLFCGIFATMVPALDWLEANAAHIGVQSAGQFYWGSGTLSGVLDNAPTYLNFLSAAVGLFVDGSVIGHVQQAIAAHGSAAAAPEIQRTIETLIRYHANHLGSVTPNEIAVAYLLANHAAYIKAISLGAVFFGSMTYIGNGPNFMVKSIAEQSGAPAPSFLAYIGRYSLPILLPVFALVWFLFFR